MKEVDFKREAMNTPEWLKEAEEVDGNVWANRYVLLAMAHQNLEALLHEACEMVGVWYCFKDSPELNRDQAAQVADWIKRVEAACPNESKAQTPQP